MSTHGLMESRMRVNGRETSLTAKESLKHQMEVFMKAIIEMESDTDTVNSLNLMGKLTKANSRKENNTVSA